jgi:TRAP-type C4-dicarboxylate transport system substrate-binding protein
MRVPASLAAAALLLSASAASSAEVTLRLSHWVPASHPIQKMGIEPWAQSIKEASGGRIEITIFPAQQLGAAPDHYDMARDGIADITHVNPGYQAGRFPIISAGELPLLITNAKAGSRAIDSWYREYAA